MTVKLVKFVAVLALAGVSASCGEMSRQGRSPVQIVIRALQAASGAESNEMGGTLQSDVIVLITDDPCSEENPCPTIVNDVGEVELALMLKDPGVSRCRRQPEQPEHGHDQPVPRRVPANGRSQRAGC